MVPFKMDQRYELKSLVEAGDYTVDETIAVVVDEEDRSSATMVQKWPVKMAVRAYKDKPRPFKLLETGVRVSIR